MFTYDDIDVLTEASAQLSDMGIAHIITEDGMILVEAGAAESRVSMRKHRNSPEGKAQALLKKKLIEKYPDPKERSKYTVRMVRDSNGKVIHPKKYEIAKMTKDEMKAVRARRLGQKHSSKFGGKGSRAGQGLENLREDNRLESKRVQRSEMLKEKRKAIAHKKLINSNRREREAAKKAALADIMKAVDNSTKGLRGRFAEAE